MARAFISSQPSSVYFTGSFGLMRITPIPFFVYELLMSAMRCSQPLANGQWLQVKITSVPAFPATSAIDTILPSTFFILAVAIGALVPSAIAPLPSAASAAGATSATARPNPIQIRASFMASSVVTSASRLPPASCQLAAYFRIDVGERDRRQPRVQAPSGSVEQEGRRQRAAPAWIQPIDELHVVVVLQ